MHFGVERLPGRLDKVVAEQNALFDHVCGFVDVCSSRCIHAKKKTLATTQENIWEREVAGAVTIFVFNIHVPHTQRGWEEGEDKKGKTESLARRRFVKALRTLPHSRAPVGGPASLP